MPPPGLRARVGLEGSRREFELVGREGARQIVEAVSRASRGRASRDWLDFGCGCGRIARYLLEGPEIERYAGVDVDAVQVAWAARHLRGRFEVMRPEPPLRFESSSFDVILAISIFTHFSNAEQLAWLSEIRRILKPGGLLVATTLAPDRALTCPGLTPAELEELAGSGFLAVDRGAAAFNERSTFHSPAYLEATWSRDLRFRLHEPRGFVSYQDLSVWENAEKPRR